MDATTKKEELLGVALSVSDEETVFYALTHEKEPEGQLSLFAEEVESVDDTAEITEALQELSAGTDTQIATFDVKHQYDYLDRSSTEQYFDVLIAAYLLNPLKNDYDMEAIASEHLGILNVYFGDTIRMLCMISVTGNWLVPDTATDSTKGDLDGDGTTTVSDLVLLNRYLLRLESLTTEQGNRADWNDDQQITVVDAMLMRRSLL